MSEWQEVMLGEVATVSWGDTSTTKKAYARQGWTAYSASGPDGLLPYFDHEDDGVVISAIGARCGKTWLARGKWSCIKNTLWMRGRPGLAQTDFLFYATADPSRWPRRGAAQPFISLGDAKAMRVLLPKLSVQRRIAAVLTGFDDLVEKDQRRIVLLEQAAQAIYREWFIHFRYPGHEDAEMIETPVGLIPKEWRVRTLDDVAAFSGGNGLTKASYVESGYTAYSAAGADGFLKTYDVEGDGVVLSAVGARCGRTWRASKRWSSIANTIRYEPRAGVAAEWLYLVTSDPQIWPRRGAAQPFISINDARGVQVVVPDDGVLQLFGETARPFFRQIDALADSIRNVSTAREMLRPKLVTGAIEVSDIDLEGLLEGRGA